MTARATTLSTVGLPVLGGFAILATGFAMIPRGPEVMQAARHAAHSLSMALPPVLASLANGSAANNLPDLTAILRTGNLAAIDRAVDVHLQRGKGVTVAQVAHDLDSFGRADVASTFIERRAEKDDPSLWTLRFMLARKLGRQADAVALLDRAVSRGSRIAPRDIEEGAYALDRTDLILTAAENRVIPALDQRLALDIARRAEAKERLDIVKRLDAVASVDWRRADPWLALRIARKTGRRDDALRYVAWLPADQQDAAREAIFREGGNMADFRAFLLERATTPQPDFATIAEQLLGAGFRDDAVLMLEQGVDRHPNDDALASRLLYLMGPRPGPRDILWLKDRAQTQQTDAAQMIWLGRYADRDRPRDALAFVTAHRLSNRTDARLIALSLARKINDRSAGEAALGALLDGRNLDDDALEAMAASAPLRLNADLRDRLARRRIKAGIANDQEQMDMAWAAWNRGDAAQTTQWLKQYLADAPTDGIALRLMGDAQNKLGGLRAARPWWEKAMAVAPPGSRDQVELLEKLGRRDDALAAVVPLRRTAPGDQSLAALEARLLIAAGRPGQARKLMRP